LCELKYSKVDRRHFIGTGLALAAGGVQDLLARAISNELAIPLG